MAPTAAATKRRCRCRWRAARGPSVADVKKRATNEPQTKKGWFRDWRIFAGFRGFEFRLEILENWPEAAEMLL